MFRDWKLNGVMEETRLQRATGHYRILQNRPATFLEVRNSSEWRQSFFDIYQHSRRRFGRTDKPLRKGVAKDGEGGWLQSKQGGGHERFSAHKTAELLPGAGISI